MIQDVKINELLLFSILDSLSANLLFNFGIFDTINNNFNYKKFNICFEISEDNKNEIIYDKNSLKLKVINLKYKIHLIFDKNLKVYNFNINKEENEEFFENLKRENFESY